MRMTKKWNGVIDFIPLLMLICLNIKSSDKFIRLSMSARIKDASEVQGKSAADFNFGEAYYRGGCCLCRGKV